MSDPREHQPTCQREIMRHADDTAAYLSEPCTCDPLVAPVVGGTPEPLREAFEAGYHCQWLPGERRYIFDRYLKPGDPEGAYRAWQDAHPEAAALIPRPEPREPEPPYVQVDYSCLCSTPFFLPDGSFPLKSCDVHRDGRPVRLRAAVRPASAPSLEQTMADELDRAADRLRDTHWQPFQTRDSINMTMRRAAARLRILVPGGDPQEP